MTSPEHHEAYAFDPMLCLWHTAERYGPYHLPIEPGLAIEARYLGEDAYSDPRGGLTGIYSVDARISSWKEGLANVDPATLIEHRLPQLIAQQEASQRDFGRDVIAEARSLGVARALPLDGLGEAVGSDEGDRLSMEIRDPASGSRLFYRGWEISQAADSPLLIHPRQSEQTVDVADLDAIAASSGEFLPHLIRDYHKYQEQGELARMMLHNLLHHEVRAEDILPDYLQRLAEIENSETQAFEAKALIFFHDWMAHGRSNGFVHAVRLFNENQAVRSVELAGGRRVDLRRYMEHGAMCPALADTENQRLGQALTLAAALQRVSDSQEPIVMRDTAEVEAFLAKPASYTVGTEGAEERAAQRRQEAHTAIALIDQSRQATDPDGFRRILERDFPEYHAVLSTLEEWVHHRNHLRPDDVLLRAWDDAGEGATPGQIVSAYGRELERRAFLGPPPKGLSRGYDRSVHIYSPQLNLILPIMASKLQMANASPQSLGQSAEQDASVVGALREKQMNSISNTHKEMRETEERRKFAAECLREVGISDEEFATLRTLGIFYAKRDGSRGGQFDDALFTAGLNALVLHKQGLINMTSRPFAAYLEELLYARTRRPRDLSTFTQRMSAL